MDCGPSLSPAAFFLVFFSTISFRDCLPPSWLRETPFPPIILSLATCPASLRTFLVPARQSKKETPFQPEDFGPLSSRPPCMPPPSERWRSPCKGFGAALAIGVFPKTKRTGVFLLVLFFSFKMEEVPFFIPLAGRFFSYPTGSLFFSFFFRGKFTPFFRDPSGFVSFLRDLNFSSSKV